MLDVDLDEFRELMATGNIVEDDMLKTFNILSQEALKITMEINNKYHTPEEIVEFFSELTGRKVYRSGFSPTHILFFVGLKPDLLTVILHRVRSAFAK